MSLLPSQCRCGADGYLTASAIDPCAQRRAGILTLPDAQPVELPPRSLQIAVHEASHAAIAHVQGSKIEGVSADPAALIEQKDQMPLPHYARAAIALAGEHGERLIIQRIEYRPPDATLLESFQIVRNFRFGGCDRCQAAFAIVAARGLDAPAIELLASYRLIENVTISTLQSPSVRAAVRHLADALMRAGTVAGPDAHRMFTDAGLPFASLTIPQP